MEFWFQVAVVFFLFDISFGIYRLRKEICKAIAQRLKEGRDDK